MKGQRNFTVIQAALGAAVAVAADVRGAPQVLGTIEAGEDAGDVFKRLVDWHDALATHEAALRNERRKLARRYFVAVGAGEEVEVPRFATLDAEIVALAQAGEEFGEALIAWCAAPADADTGAGDT